MHVCHQAESLTIEPERNNGLLFLFPDGKQCVSGLNKNHARNRDGCVLNRAGPIGHRTASIWVWLLLASRSRHLFGGWFCRNPEAI
jgi:hypothetical protein